MQHAEQVLDRRAQKFTPIRRQVLQALLSSHRPLGAYEVIDELAKSMPRPAPITVYRALDFLMDNGLVHRIESRNAYLACAHDHDAAAMVAFLICEHCGSVGEIPAAPVAQSLNAAARATGFTPKLSVVEITGTCAHCQTREWVGHDPSKTARPLSGSCPTRRQAGYGDKCLQIQRPSAGRPLSARRGRVMLMLCLSWGFNQIAVKLALPDVPPMLQALIRSAGALPVMLSIGGFAASNSSSATARWSPGLCAGLLFGLEFVLIFRGLMLTSASRAVVFLYTAPFFVALGSYQFLGERLARRNGAAWA